MGSGIMGSGIMGSGIMGSEGFKINPSDPIYPIYLRALHLLFTIPANARIV